MDQLDHCESSASLPRLEHADVYSSNRVRVGASLFQRFVQAIGFSSNGMEPEGIHVHKVCLLKKDAEEMKLRLENIKQKALHENELELGQMVQEVIDPMLRDIDRIMRTLQRENGVCKAYEEFRIWIEGARLWEDLFSNQNDKQAITEQVVKHIIIKSIEKIERDLSALESYLNEHIGQLEMPSEQVEEVRIEKKNSLKALVDDLSNLQRPPAGQTLEEVNTWRRELDIRRAALFADALDIIDS